MRYVLLGVFVIGVVLFFEIAHQRDQWRLCRALGHSATYCTVAKAFD